MGLYHGPLPTPITPIYRSTWNKTHHCFITSPCPTEGSHPLCTLVHIQFPEMGWLRDKPDRDVLACVALCFFFVMFLFIYLFLLAASARGTNDNLRKERTEREKRGSRRWKTRLQLNNNRHHIVVSIWNTLSKSSALVKDTDRLTN